MTTGLSAGKKSNSNRLRKLAFIVIVCAIVGTLIWMFSARTAMPVGVILPLSGDGASYGKTLQKGIELYLDERKAPSQTITPIYEDSRLSQIEAVSAFQKLTGKDGVSVVLGPFSSSEMLSLAPLAERSKTVLISATATAPAISQAGRYIFRIIPSDVYDGRVVAHLIRKQLPEASRVAIVAINNDYGQGIYQAFQAEAERLTLSAGEPLFYPPNTTEFRTLLRRLSNEDPDVLFLIGYKEMGQFLRQANQLGFGAPIVSTGLMEDPEIVNIAGKGAEGVLYSYPSFNPDASEGLTARFVSAYNQRYGSPPDVIAALGYDLMGLVASALPSDEKEADGESIRNRLAETKSFPGVAGDITFDENGDVVKPSGIKMVREGRFVWVDERLEIEMSIDR